MKLKVVILVACLSVAMVGCMQHRALETQQRPQTWAKLIHYDRNFYQVSPHIFRSEQPLKSHSDDLNQRGIQTIINLRPNNKTADELDSKDFKIVHVPIYTWKINREDVVATMKAIKQARQNNENILIHCYHGSDRTGAMVAMYRIVFENWTTENAVKEMKYGGYGFHTIWKNIDKLFNPENVTWIKQQVVKEG